MTENGRTTQMFCVFEGQPRILRLYGRGEVIRPHHPDWARLRNMFPTNTAGMHQIFRSQLTRVKTSCGFGVPLMQLVPQRDNLLKWAEKKGDDGRVGFQQKHNRRSFEGLPIPV